ncbi:MAG: biotin transporter BioY [Candidatus Sericytochromatia bacterium]|nr:biotin transporter BioY [Candidatus Sericytochromatia bacterium]
MSRFLLVFFLITLLACSAFVAVKVPFLLVGPPRHLPTAETLYQFKGLVFGSHVITGQVPALWLTAAVLGPRLGVIAVIFYLGIGFGGLPIFTNGGGRDYYQQPTFGYLLACLPAVWVAGRHTTGDRFGRIWLGMFWALALVQGLGLIYELFREDMLGSLVAWRQLAFNQVLQYLPGHLAVLTVMAAGFSGWRKLRAAPSRTPPQPRPAAPQQPPTDEGWPLE